MKPSVAPTTTASPTGHQALSAYTAAAAYAGFMESRTGSLRVGKLADFIVLDRSPFEVQPEDIHSLRVELTFVGGRQVFGAGS